jgi:hypothetical protein
MSNTFKKKEEDKAKESPVAAKRIRAARKYIHMLNVFGHIEKGMAWRFMPFAFFLFGICILYIGNSYMAEKTIRDIDKTSKDIKELRSEYITIKSDLMFKSRQSQVAKEVLPLGIKHLTVPPKKIVLKNSAPTEK